MHEDREARLVRRIESFSDLVMGFSLALLALTLVIPQHTAELFTNAWWLVAYFWTFFYIASVFLQHQRLFEKFFVPSGIAIKLNFVLLSILVLVVYFVQVFSHVRGDADKALAFLVYFAAFGCSRIAMGMLFALGARERWSVLSTDDRRYGLRSSVRSIAVGAALTAAVIYDSLIRASITFDSVSKLAFVVAGTVIAVRVALFYVEPRVLHVPAAAESAA